MAGDLITLVTHAYEIDAKKDDKVRITDTLTELGQKTSYTASYLGGNHGTLGQIRVNRVRWADLGSYMPGNPIDVNGRCS